MNRNTYLQIVLYAIETPLFHWQEIQIKVETLTFQRISKRALIIFPSHINEPISHLRGPRSFFQFHRFNPVQLMLKNDTGPLWTSVGGRRHTTVQRR
jgi:hypothetical protein